LGYQRSVAEKALGSVMRNGAPKSESPRSFDALFRETLGALSK
jgi:hypothetical protein